MRIVLSCGIGSSEAAPVPEPLPIAESQAAAALGEVASPDASVPSPSANGQDQPAAEHQLGILFVHGIGEQPEGETLLGFGEPVLGWLHRWLGREKVADRGKVANVEV